LTALNDIAAQLTSTRAVDELLRQITTHARRLLGVDLAYIGVVHGEEFVFEVCGATSVSVTRAGDQASRPAVSALRRRLTTGPAPTQCGDIGVETDIRDGHLRRDDLQPPLTSQP
jgi:GAF domain-containing protein